MSVFRDMFYLSEHQLSFEALKEKTGTFVELILQAKAVRERLTPFSLRMKLLTIDQQNTGEKV